MLGEFRYGIAGSRHSAAYESWLATHLAQFEVLAMAQEATITYAALRVAVKRLGRPIPANDASIAALALQLGMPILSRDEHLDVVPDLARKTW